MSVRKVMDLKYIIFYFLWLIVILPKSAQFFSLGFIALIMLRDLWKNNKLKPDCFAVFILLYSLVHFVSIIYNLSENSYSIDRIIAAFHTMSLWFVAIIIYHYYINTDDISLKRIGIICLYNIMILSILSIIAILTYRFGLEIELPLVKRKLYIEEIIKGIPYFRFRGFIEVSVAVSRFVLLQYPPAMLGVFLLDNEESALYKKCYNINIPYERIKPYLVIILSIIFSLPIYMSRSRIGYVLYAGVVLIYFVNYFLRKYPKKTRIYYYFIAGIVSVILLAFLRQQTLKIINILLNMRINSNRERMSIYTDSIDAFLKSPIIGCGIKTLNTYNNPLGSHNTYLGFLYKTGIVGCIFALTAFAIVFKRLFCKLASNNNWIYRTEVFCLLLMMVNFFFEDMDGVDWLCCMWFALLGIAGNMNSWKIPSDNLIDSAITTNKS